MIDWSEGHHQLKSLVAWLYQELLNGNYNEARTICDNIVVEARLTRAKIREQGERDETTS